MTAVATTNTKTKPAKTKFPKTKQWYSWREFHDRVKEVCGEVNLQHLKNIANTPGMFLTGRNKDGLKAPLPRLYPVDRESADLWLYGASTVWGDDEK